MSFNSNVTSFDNNETSFDNNGTCFDQNGMRSASNGTCFVSKRTSFVANETSSDDNETNCHDRETIYDKDKTSKEDDETSSNDGETSYEHSEIKSEGNRIRYEINGTSSCSHETSSSNESSTSNDDFSQPEASSNKRNVHYNKIKMLSNLTYSESNSSTDCSQILDNNELSCSVLSVNFYRFSDEMDNSTESNSQVNESELDCSSEDLGSCSYIEDKSMNACASCNDDRGRVLIKRSDNHCDFDVQPRVLKEINNLKETCAIPDGCEHSFNSSETESELSLCYKFEENSSPFKGDISSNVDSSDLDLDFLEIN